LSNREILDLAEITDAQDRIMRGDYPDEAFTLSGYLSEKRLATIYTRLESRRIAKLARLAPQFRTPLRPPVAHRMKDALQTGIGDNGKPIDDEFCRQPLSPGRFAGEMSETVLEAWEQKWDAAEDRECIRECIGREFDDSDEN
jgi:hypothetical protein